MLRYARDAAEATPYSGNREDEHAADAGLHEIAEIRSYGVTYCNITAIGVLNPILGADQAAFRSLSPSPSQVRIESSLSLTPKTKHACLA